VAPATLFESVVNMRATWRQSSTDKDSPDRPGFTVRSVSMSSRTKCSYADKIQAMAFGLPDGVSWKYAESMQRHHIGTVTIWLDCRC
jgi:hypothetical protein